jgi:hypothetical protein
MSKDGCAEITGWGLGYTGGLGLNMTARWNAFGDRINLWRLNVHCACSVGVGRFVNAANPVAADVLSPSPRRWSIR